MRGVIPAHDAYGYVLCHETLYQHDASPKRDAGGEGAGRAD